ncbi:kelch repeat-containing protein [Clostridium sp. E02]|uniref:kelch repeat-containing protein n=1 Tax=Clostridium sp. E02 TaxID=2487134 RepID=UPI000F54A8D6|nr:kelch repeat-containing protein [Clostridium sp. E02]
MKKRSLFQITMVICFMISVMFLGQSSAFAEEVEPTWTKVASMSVGRGELQTEVIDGKIYAIGGQYGGDALSTTEVYDLATNTWRKLASMSDARRNFQSIEVNGKIYAIGGNNYTKTLQSTEVYDPATDTWTKLASMLDARCSFHTEVLDGKIYAIGGHNGRKELQSTEVYDPATDTWTKLASMSDARYFSETEVIDGKIYAIGGYNGSKELQSMEVYDPATDTWTKLASMSDARRNFQSIEVNGKIYAIGGYNGSEQIKSTEVYDPETNTWTQLAPMSVAKWMFQTELVNGKIYALGDLTTRKTTEVYDPVTDTWTKLASRSINRAYFRTETIDGKIYVIGGNGNDSSVEVYTVMTSSVKHLKAIGGDTKVDLTWDAVANATSYTIKRSTTAGGSYNTIATDITDTTYTDNDVTNGTAYYYVVTAIADGRETGNSNEASATPTAGQTPPPVDTKLKVVLEVYEALRLSVDDDLNVNTEMAWSSSDEAVATVNEKGIVTALAPGNTVITVKSVDGSYTDYINVLVVENAEDYRLAIDLNVGETARLTADDFTNTANVTWAPMDSSIANVTIKGKVTALSKGLVLITAKDKDGKIIGKIYVRVRE